MDNQDKDLLPSSDPFDNEIDFFNEEDDSNVSFSANPDDSVLENSRGQEVPISKESKLSIDRKTIAIIGAIAAIAIVVIVIAVLLFRGRAVEDVPSDDGEDSGYSETNLTPEEQAELDAFNEGAVDVIIPTVDEANPEVVDGTFKGSPDFTTEQLLDLYLAGFTSEEIESIEDLTGLDDIIDAKRKQTLTAYQEQVSEILGVTDDEEEVLLLNTWYGLPLRELSERLYDDAGMEYEVARFEVRENVNFEKIPLHGNQTFIKLFLDNGDVLFFAIDPQRYSEMEDNGNIVIQYIHYNYRGVIFYEDIKEVKLG